MSKPERAAPDGIVDGALEEGLADPLRHPALHLALGQERVHQAPDPRRQSLRSSD